ncbi:MAG: peptidylprolyl isomerase [Myxococcota bacterium]|jgi:cyclophilin family peptidyl-prolyl cis-trans isomerase|nr:peptidylprolyl isomerase [Myxococcota bacterium]
MIGRTTQKLLLPVILAGTLCLGACSDGNATPAQEAAKSTPAAKAPAPAKPPAIPSPEPPTSAANPLPSFQGDDVAIDALDAFIAESSIDKSQPRWKSALPMPPKVEFDSGKTYYWHLNTNVGPIKVKLMPETAPMHVSSTVYLTRLGFYDDVIFHRVIPGFMAQGGDPDGMGRGGPGYKYAGEFDSAVRHDRPGLLSMANSGPGTDGSQFFLTFVPTPHLNGKHTIFGEVVDGRETLKALEDQGSRGGRTKQRLVIEEATVNVE